MYCDPLHCKVCDGNNVINAKGRFPKRIIDIRRASHKLGSAPYIFLHFIKMNVYFLHFLKRNDGCQSPSFVVSYQQCTSSQSDTAMASGAMTGGSTPPWYAFLYSEHLICKKEDIQ